MAFVGTMTSLRNNIIPTEQSVELTITKNTITIDPNSGSYFFLDDIDSNLTINISSLSASSKTIYLRLNFIQDNVVINWPNNIKWQEISPPTISQYEDLFISLMTLDGGTTWYSEPVIKTKPIVDLSNYMESKYPSTRGSLTSLPLTDLNYFNSVRPISCNSMIRDCSSLTSIDLSDFDTSNVTNMSSMFGGCNSLTSLNVSNFDTSNVTRMDHMFTNCSLLTSLDISNWDTSNVTRMNQMFDHCSSLTSLDISNWDTSNVTGNLYSTFGSCSSLTSLDLSGWDTSSLEYMQDTFGNCINLVTLDLSNWTSPSTYDSVFSNCDSLKYLILDSNTCKFKVQPNEDCKIIVPLDYITAYTNDSAWSSRANKTIVPIEAFDITKSNGGVYASIDWDWIETEEYSWPGYKWVKDFYPTTYTTMTQLDTNGRDFLTTVGGNYNCDYMFAGCSNLTTLDLSNVDFSNATSMSNIFDGDSNLTTINVTGTKVNNTSAPIIGQKATTGISNLDISVVTDCSNMFKNNTALTTVDLSSWDTSAITNTSSMFDGCSNLTSLNLSGLDLSGVTSCGNMFKDAPLTAGIDVTNTKVNNTDAATICQKASNTSAKDVDISLLTNMSSLFNGNTRLTSIDLTDWDTSNVTNTSSMFNNCTNLITIDISGCDFREVTTATGMFDGCSSLNSIDVTGTKISNRMVAIIGRESKTLGTIANLDVSAVTDMLTMFSNNTTATTLDLSGWDTSRVTRTSSMFNGCSSLTSVDLSGLDFSAATTVYNMFNGCSSLTSVDLSGVDFSAVTSASGMFQGCSSLTSVDLSGVDFSALTNASYMFNGCRSLTSLDLSGVDFSAVTTTSNMFYGCSSLTSLDLSSWDTSALQSLDYMFVDCYNIKILDVSNWDTSVTGKYMYGYSYDEPMKLDYLILSNKSSPLIPSPYSKHVLCDLSVLDTYRTKFLDYTVYPKDAFNIVKSNGLISVSINWSYAISEGLSMPLYFWAKDFYPDTYDTMTTLSSDGLNVLANINAYCADHMFDGCAALTFVDTTNFNFAHAIKCSYMFKGSNVQSAIISNRNFNDAISYKYMLTDSNLSIIDMSDFDNRNASEDSMFYNTDLQYVIIDSLEIKFIPKYILTFNPSAADKYNPKGCSGRCVVLVPDSMISSYNNTSWGGYNFNRTTRLKPLENYIITRSSSGITVTPNAIQLSSFTVNLNSSSSSSTVTYTKTVEGNDITYLITQNQYVIGDYCSNTPAITVDISYTLDTANQTIAFNGNNAPATETYYLIALDNTRVDPTDSTKSYVAAVSGKIVVTFNN